MPVDPNEIVVAGNGRIFVAPVGTAAPTDTATAWPAGWVDLGYATEDGVTISKGRDVTEVRVWQSRLAVRRFVTSETLDVSFSLVQWNADTIPLAFGGGDVVTAGGVSTYTPPESGALDERAVGIEWVDGDRVHRLVLERSMVSDAVETNLNATSPAELPITMSALAVAGGLGWSLIFDEAA